MAAQDADISELLAIGHNGLLIPRLANQIISTRGVVPFVGAGMSVPYKLPEWDELLKSLAVSEAGAAEVCRLLNRKPPDYEAAAEYLVQLHGPARFQLLFRSAFDVAVDTGAKTPLTTLMDFPPGPIITTNFDRVLESVFQAAAIPPKVISGNSPEEISEALQFYTASLLKIHGDVETSGERVLTASDYDKQYSA